PATTVAALEAGRGLLAAGGRMTVVAYTGHPGGADEAAAVRAWAEGLAGDRHRVESGRGERAPQLVIIDRA
ncbi:MAG TPA: class I SAM-dependent methyltransferase, partial [Gammaproteobacteria bacterium]|nr:class I SAM-dependent methyltransferase [Gammaproteobacteria bacterium]